MHLTNLPYHHKHHYFCVIQNSFTRVPVGIITVTYLCTVGIVTVTYLCTVGIVTVAYFCTCRDYYNDIPVYLCWAVQAGLLTRLTFA